MARRAGRSRSPTHRADARATSSPSTRRACARRLQRDQSGRADSRRRGGRIRARRVSRRKPDLAPRRGARARCRRMAAARSRARFRRDAPIAAAALVALPRRGSQRCSGRGLLRVKGLVATREFPDAPLLDPGRAARPPSAAPAERLAGRRAAHAPRRHRRTARSAEASRIAVARADRRARDRPAGSCRAHRQPARAAARRAAGVTRLLFV